MYILSMKGNLHHLAIDTVYIYNLLTKVEPILRRDSEFISHCKSLTGPSGFWGVPAEH